MEATNEATAPARAVVAGEDLGSMTSSEIEARLSDIEAAANEAESRLAKAKREAVQAGLAGTDNVPSASAELARLREEAELRKQILEEVREALQAALEREKKTAVESKVQALREELDGALELAQQVEEHANAMADALLEYRSRVLAAVDKARANFQGRARGVLRITGGGMAHWQPVLLQRTLEIHLHARTKGLIRSDSMPIRGGLFFARLMGNAQNELLSSVEAYAAEQQQLAKE